MKTIPQWFAPGMPIQVGKHLVREKAVIGDIPGREVAGMVFKTEQPA